MSYLGLSLDSLVFELNSLMKNNYSDSLSKDERFELAKKDILEMFSNIIEDNREEVEE